MFWHVFTITITIIINTVGRFHFQQQNQLLSCVLPRMYYLNRPSHVSCLSWWSNHLAKGIWVHGCEIDGFLNTPADILKKFPNGKQVKRRCMLARASAFSGQQLRTLLKSSSGMAPSGMSLYPYVLLNRVVPFNQWDHQPQHFWAASSWSILQFLQYYTQSQVVTLPSYD